MEQAEMIRKHLSKYCVILALVFTVYFIGFPNILDIQLNSAFKVESRTVRTATEKPVRPIKVLLLTAHRSGSTFVGELFNQNDDAFYLFEPLGALQTEHSTLGCENSPDKKIDHLVNYYNCQAPTFLPPNSQKQSSKTVIAVNHQGYCQRNNVCFRGYHRWSCGDKLCTTPTKDQNETLANLDDTVPRGRCDHSCTGLNSTFIERVCSSKEIIAQKVIRLCDLDDVEKLIAKIPDLKVIVTFRDPRGIYRSRKSLLKPSILDDTIKKTCKIYQKMLQRKSLLDQKRFFFVRYEDMSMAQMKTAEAIYSFVGINMSQSVRNWLEKELTFKDKAVDQYSTHRNSTYTATKWRTMMSFPEVEKVQEVCKDVLRDAGYYAVPDIKSLKNMDFPVFGVNPWD